MFLTVSVSRSVRTKLLMMITGYTVSPVCPRYFNPRREGEESQCSRCVHCSTPLTLCCVTCLMSSRQPSPVLCSAPPAPAPAPPSQPITQEEEDHLQDSTDDEVTADSLCDNNSDDDTESCVTVSNEGMQLAPVWDKKQRRSARIPVVVLKRESLPPDSFVAKGRGKTKSSTKPSPSKRRDVKPPSNQRSASLAKSGPSRRKPSVPSYGTKERFNVDNEETLPLPIVDEERYPICDGIPFKDGHIPSKQFSEYRCSRCDNTFPNKPSIKRHLKQADCEDVQPSLPTGPKRFEPEQKPTERESDLGRVPSDSEGSMVNSRSYFTDPDKEHTIEEFMTGKVPILTGCARGSNSSRGRSVSHYACDRCHKVFVSEQEYQSHEENHEKDGDGITDSDPVQTGPDAESLQILTEIKERLLYCCPHCSRIFTSQKEHRQHVHSHKFAVDADGNYTCNFCGESYKKLLSLATHQSLREDRKSCKQCGLNFISNCQVKDHMKTHSKESKCETCGESLDCLSKSEIKKHMKTHKTTPSLSLCPICGKAVSKNSIAHHMFTHTDKRPFPCSMCDKRFKNKMDLNYHLKIHVKAFQCETCGAYFSHAAGLRAHRAFKHDGKYFECKECGKKLARSITLKKHIRLVHRKNKPFACTVCEFTSGDKKHLDQHMRIHTGEKPYQCQFCPSRFARKDNLKLHVRTHTGEKPYECEDCGQRFTCRTSLLLHRRNRHRDRLFPCTICGQEFPLQSSLDFHCHNEHGGDFPTINDCVQTPHNSSMQQPQMSSGINNLMTLPSKMENL